MSKNLLVEKKWDSNLKFYVLSVVTCCLSFVIRAEVTTNISWVSFHRKVSEYPKGKLRCYAVSQNFEDMHFGPVSAAFRMVTKKTFKMTRAKTCKNIFMHPKLLGAGAKGNQSNELIKEIQFQGFKKFFGVKNKYVVNFSGKSTTIHCLGHPYFENFQHF